MPSAHPNHPPFLANFYSPTSTPAPDPSGRTLSSILAWPDSALEYHHDYIQYLFPLPEGSPFNPSAPVVDHATCVAFRAQSELRAQLRKSWLRMLRFYGLKYVVSDGASASSSSSGSSAKEGSVVEGTQPCGGRVVKGSNWTTASRNWVMRFNHNHLRITRIIRSLRVLGCEGDAEAFFEGLCRIYDEGRGIGERSLMFWTRAATRPLWLAPEVEEKDTRLERGLEWLVELEKGREEGCGENGKRVEKWRGSKDGG